MSNLHIRKAAESDAPALSRICLLTANAGKSADDLHDIKELPGLVFAVPYVKLPTTWGFVLVDEEEKVVGYVLGSKDSRAYERYAAEHWWPALAAKYTPSSLTKPTDVRYAKMLADMFTASEACIRFAAAHLHIDILEEHQRRGWGRKLIEAAVEYLKGEEIEGNGVWLAMDPNNLEAGKFYEKLGFGRVDGAEESVRGLRW